MDIVYILTNNINVSKESRIMQPSKMCKSLNHYMEKQIINVYNDFRYFPTQIFLDGDKVELLIIVWKSIILEDINHGQKEIHIIY